MLRKLLENNSIRNKIVRVMLVASNASLILVFFVVVLSEALLTKDILQDAYKHSQENNIADIAALVVDDNKQLLEQKLESVARNEQVLSISVRKAGKEYAALGLADNIEDSVLNRYFNPSVFKFDMPLRHQGKKIGAVHYDMQSSSARSSIWLLLLTLLTALVLSNLIAYALSRFLSKRVSDPILALAEISHQVTNYNDYALRSEMQSDDEIGLLSDNFNEMLEQIQLRDKMLAEKVEQRTHELEKLNDRLSYDAHHDVLTGLPNRSLFSDRAKQALKDSDRNKNKVAIFFIDLDNFKTINDTLGHEVGDKLLQIVAQRLQQVVRKNDTVSRFGGDEFNILLRDISDAYSAEVIANKILRDLQKSIQVDTHMLNVTASIGLALYPDHAKNVTALQQHADTAMYSAKELGKNKYQLYTEQLNVKNNERLILINDLRNAVLNDEFQLVYQPKMDARDDTIFGVETLIRWHHPEKGLVMPDRFIPFAEESGIIVDIDMWVLRTACKQVQDWNVKYNRNISLAVNMSSHHFSDENFIQVISDLLNETGMPAENLEFELTERVLVDSGDLTMTNLKSLKALGSRLSIDDFGTGYSSLNYLRQFPIDIVKIDKSFIADLTMDPDDATLTLAMILLAKSLSLDVIAEGVETAAQKEMLLAYGCHLMQGYFFYKPLAPDVFEQEIYIKNDKNNNVVYINNSA